MKEKEIRKLDIQFRAEDTEDGKMEIKGYAAVFNSPETYSYTETIDSRAFDDADMSDVVLRYNHNDSFMVLARTRNKSLGLNVDEKGLMIDATLQDDITDHRNIYNAIKSGLIDKQSFAFTVDEDEYDYDFKFHSTLFMDENIDKINEIYEKIKDIDVSSTEVIDTIVIGESKDGINFKETISVSI